MVSLNASYLSFALTLMAQHAERVMGDPYLARELFAAVLELSAPHHDKAAAAAQPLKVRSETEWGAKGERERNREREREREREPTTFSSACEGFTATEKSRKIVAGFRVGDRSHDRFASTPAD